MDEAVEAVRLVIWDLDETFWSGTLTEGGITYRQAAHDTVIKLAQRGIISAICSKNDHSRVQTLLTQAGIWDYFVFPSIDWEPKGPRLARLVRDIGLRPASVLFIDDNPANLAEARAHVPDMQTASETLVPDLLADPRLSGKPDPSLARLEQYRRMQERHAEAPAAGTDTSDFLRASNIVVRLEHDPEPHLDRAIDLINRTNQLNYTKLRLPEDPTDARAELMRMLRGYNRHFGILHVRDRYGDHGWCGLYVLQADMDGRHLLEFCFSCRVLNMGIETWLYRHLGRPVLRVRGEVLTDVKAEGPPVDWITLDHAAGLPVPDDRPRAFDYLYVRGGCELRALSHYFADLAPREMTDVNLIRANRPVRLDHSVFIHHAASGLPEAARADVAAVGFTAEDFSPELLRMPESGRGLWILSLWCDANTPLYRHRRTGILLPVRRSRAPQNATVRTPDLTKANPADYPGDEVLIETVKREFEFASTISETAFRANVRALLGRLRPPARAFLLLANDSLDGDPRQQDTKGRFARLNAWTIDEAHAFAGVTIVDTRAFIASQEEIHDPLHFNRAVYFRIFQHITSMLAAE